MKNYTILSFFGVSEFLILIHRAPKSFDNVFILQVVKFMKMFIFNTIIDFS